MTNCGTMMSRAEAGNRCNGGTRMFSCRRLGDGDREQSVPAATRGWPVRAAKVSRAYLLLGECTARANYFHTSTHHASSIPNGAGTVNALVGRLRRVRNCVACADEDSCRQLADQWGASAMACRRATRDEHFRAKGSCPLRTCARCGTTHYTSWCTGCGFTANAPREARRGSDVALHGDVGRGVSNG